MKKLYKILTLAAAILVPSLANAVAITSVTPLPGSTYSTSNSYIELTTSEYQNTLILNGVTCSYGDVVNAPLTDAKSNWNNFDAGSNIFYYWLAKDHPNFYIKPPIDAIMASGATEFTITINGWKDGSTKTTSNLSGVNIDSNGTVTMTYKVPASDSGNTGGNTGGDSGNDYDGPYASSFEWDTPMVMGDGTVLTIETSNNTGGAMYVKTNSNTQLAFEDTSSLPNFVFTDLDCTNGISWDEIIATDEGYVYVKTELYSWIPYYVKYKGNATTFTFVEGIYDNDDDTVEGTPIEWDTVYTPGSTGEHIYTFEGKNGPAQIVTVAKYEIMGMTLYANGKADQAVSLSTVETSDGYTYNTGDLEEGVTYQLTFFNPDAKLTFEIKQGNTEIVADPVQIFPGNEVTLNSKGIYYYSATADGTLTIEVVGTQGGETWPMPTFVYDSAAHDNALTDGVTTGTDIYTIEVTQGLVYYFYYDSSNISWIVTKVTFVEPVVQPEYMGMASNAFVEEDGAQNVYIYWTEQIFAATEGSVVKGTLQTPEDVQVSVELQIVSYNPEETDSYVDNALVYNAASAITQYGAGAYTLVVAQGVVKNEEGNVNMTTDAPFEIEAQVTESEVEAAVVVTASEITVSWENQPIKILNNYAEAVITNVDDPEDVLVVEMNDGMVLSESGTTLVITLPEEALTDGATYKLVIEAQSFLIGGDTEFNQAVTYQFQYESTGVNGIGAAMEEGAVIYNLQGQKVANPAKGGIYIVNGKKVVVK